MGKNKSKKSKMTKEKFKRRLDEYGLTYLEFSNLIGYHHQTIKQWGDGDIPYFVEVVLEYLDLIHMANKNIEGRVHVETR